MKLYTQRRAPNPRRVHMFLAEKGLEIHTVDFDIMAGAHRSDELRALNPAMTLPVLVLDDGTPIAESVAICRYIEELHPEPCLMGRTALERATTEMWNRRAELLLALPVMFTVRHAVPAFAVLEPEQVADWAALSRRKALEGMSLLNHQLEKTQFIAGPEFTIADITAFVGVEFGRIVKLSIPEEMTGLTRWRAEVAARPSASA
ncbi:MAG: glutathione S-transferase family protein [Flavobacteriaceae bacterium]